MALGAPLRVEPALIVAAPSPVPLSGGEGERPLLAVGAPVKELLCKLAAPEGVTKGLSEGSVDGETNAEREAGKASEGEGPPLPEANPVGAPLSLGAADAELRGVKREKGLDVPLNASPLSDARALCERAIVALAEAAAEGEGEADPGAETKGDAVSEMVGSCEALALCDSPTEGELQAVAESAAVSLGEAAPLPLSVPDAQAQPEGEGDADAQAVTEKQADGVPCAAEKSAVGDAPMDSEGAFDEDSVPAGEKVAARVPDGLSVRVAQPE